MTTIPAWRRGPLYLLVCMAYGSFVLWFWGEFLKLSIVTNIFLVAWVILKHFDVRKEQLRADSEKLRADQIGERQIDRVPYHVGKLEIRAEIANLNGDCDTEWIWTEIRKVHPDSQLSCIPARIEWATPGCSFSQFPTLMPWCVDKYKIEFLNLDTNVCYFQVRMNEVTNEIGYGYTASINKAFYMCEEYLAEQRYKYEWFGFIMTVAVESLTIRVVFPPHYKPDSVQPDVCPGGVVTTAYRDDTEVERILGSGGFKSEWGEASMTVKKPKMGYIYFLRWRPLPKVVVDVMKQRESLIAER